MAPNDKNPPEEDKALNIITKAATLVNSRRLLACTFFMSALIIAIIAVDKSLSGESISLNIKTFFAIPILIAFCGTLFLGLKCIIDIKNEERLVEKKEERLVESENNKIAVTDQEAPSSPPKPGNRIPRRRD